MGADNSGRDVFSRLCYGSRVSMTIGLVGSLFILIIGLAFGGAMGYFGGRMDDLLYSFSQMVMLLPGFYLLLMLRFTFPQNMDSGKVYFAIILILSLVGWPSFALVIRGMVKSIMQESYVMAARAMGLSHARIIAKHVLPNTTSYVIVTMTLRIPAYILGESALSLLGLGITEPTPSWGNMLNKARDIVELNLHPWVLWPGLFIFLAVIAFNLVGDGLRDALDPRPAQRPETSSRNAWRERSHVCRPDSFTRPRIPRLQVIPYHRLGIACRICRQIRLLLPVFTARFPHHHLMRFRTDRGPRLVGSPEADCRIGLKATAAAIASPPSR